MRDKRVFLAAFIVLGFVMKIVVEFMLGAVMLASPERNFQVAYLSLMFIPSLLSFVVEYFLFYPSRKLMQIQTISPMNKAVIKPAVMKISMGKPGVAQTMS